MLSNHAIGAPQVGQRERGRTTDWSNGRRTMHTLRKLPSNEPKSPAATTTPGSGRTGRPEQQDARRYGHVEGLSPSGQGDGHGGLR